MGLYVSVYRNAHHNQDFSRNGISNRFTQLCVVNVDGPFEPNEHRPAVMLKVGAFGNVTLVPVDEHVDRWVMFGGNYAACSDSRLSNKIEEMTGKSFYGAIPIHDRVEDY